MNKIHDSICSGLAQQSERAMDAVNSNADASALQEHRTVLEMYGFLLTWFSQCAETFKSSDEDGAPVPRAKRGRGGKAMAARSIGRKESWSRDVYVRPTLMLLEKVLRVKTQRIWTAATERDAFIE
jgi:condensin complex subunit 1